ncbi:hypothetical protein A3C09_00575 [Candidatus Uhrbacteria bacterium RIFCSPHIGHO2_02_FULL_47_44]|uniref:Addiction module toxin, HicA family n=1 Tax=Candidatus Uhrbacteria bacterium RIFCSPLOWO2_02_FULL_48_18 TaxID=1802408 RepID=A0A1F7V8B6_9BACT|nr:MAG: hypothetical protein A2839_01640 [Candidatus Uhrbacteria bacterium RIFCSPHIGHO2_01_FULL_47_10]OGL70832.1 MAG: hypothetical protein A3C09_00575 [Candidatus Uhrbacteria bacterium RIFCSPHIGHO2_02_FULL_47_44]OGL76686.1 MAG: hypothetical protein A3E97_02105 [Candidatus Uhrbacteria bacterium RIFCSPHIGHO2_12_FULL_47_12]OGL82591.1 MAG: hypothetical protein A3B20_00095 [Candidatus Uhrbacteria bacterium RIFCSPLOWO2_01_FULL_47_17]OGL86802.1 MAG: hypothetical protein A3I41_04465 [Candidatus Uhrbact
MGEFSNVDWKLFEVFLIAHGCGLERIKGDHCIYVKNGLRRAIVVPKRDPLPPFIVLNNLHVLGISKEEFLNWLREN